MIDFYFVGFCFALTVLMFDLNIQNQIFIQILLLHCLLLLLLLLMLPLLELGHGVVGTEDLRISGAGVAEVLLLVGVVQVASQSRQLGRDLKVPQSLGHHLWTGGAAFNF